MIWSLNILLCFFQRCSDQSELKRHTTLRKMEMLPNVLQKARVRVLSSVDGRRVVHMLSLPQELKQNSTAIFILFFYWNVCLRSLRGRACVTMSNAVHVCKHCL